MDRAKRGEHGRWQSSEPPSSTDVNRSSGSSSSGSLIEPEGVEADDVVDAEVVVWIVTLHVIPPYIVDLLPRNGQYRRGPLLDLFPLPPPNQARVRAALPSSCPQRAIA